MSQFNGADDDRSHPWNNPGTIKQCGNHTDYLVKKRVKTTEIPETWGLFVSSSRVPAQNKFMSKFQSLIEQSLRFWLPTHNIVVNYRPNWMMGLELDFIIPKMRVAIEVQGDQHVRWAIGLQRGIRAFDDQQRRDWAKKLLCKHHGLKLMRVFHGTGNLRKRLGKLLGVELPELPAHLMSEITDHKAKLNKLAEENAAKLALLGYNPRRMRFINRHRQRVDAKKIAEQTRLLL